MLPSFFFNQDLWSWTAAILQDSMPSLLIHLLHIFRISRFFYDGCWFPSCNVVLSRRAKAMISLLSLCYHGCWLQLCNQWQLLIALLACAMFVDVLTGSHSSAGQSVRLITVRSTAQARVGPVLAPGAAGSLVTGPPVVAHRWQGPPAPASSPIARLGENTPTGLIAQLVRAYG